MHIYTRKIQFYETDQMGIVHHSNYLRLCEEARVDWAHSHNLIDYQKPGSAAHFAVLETRVKHLRPASFGDNIQVQVQVRHVGIRIEFQYRLIKQVLFPSLASERSLSIASSEADINSDKIKLFEDQVLVLAQTIHVPLGVDLKPIKLPKPMREILEKELWKETWL